MKTLNRVLLTCAVIVLCVIAVGRLSPAVAQDVTTQLVLFLADLRAQTLGVSQPLASVNVTSGYKVNGTAGVGFALAHANPANQTGNATATFKMNGLGAAAAPCTITPVSSGRIVFVITGQVQQNTTADGSTFKLAEGTGAAPANAAAATGTVISATQTWTALTGNLIEQFSVTASATGFTLNTAVWFDLQLADVTGGTASLINIDCTAYEI